MRDDSRKRARQLATMSACLVFAVLLAARLPGQQGVVARNFRVSPGYHDPPNDRQIKSLLEGASAQPEPGGRYLVREVRLRTFTPLGATIMEVLTPEARYDQNRKEVSSAQKLQMRTAEGRFAIEGEGFLWRQTNSSLVISNRVRTTISPDLLQGRGEGAGPGSEGPVLIQAGSFDYSGETGFGRYAGGVTVTGTNLSLAGESLLIDVPSATQVSVATNLAVKSLLLERKVLMDYQGVHAAGERVVYTTSSGVVEVDGNPKWRTQFREGSADRITIDASNRVFRALGNALLNLEGPEVERGTFLGGWFAGAATSSGADSADPDAVGKAKPGAGRKLEFRSRNYEVRTNLAVFDGGVRVGENVGGLERGTLTCEQLSLEFAGTNELKSMKALGGATEGSKAEGRAGDGWVVATQGDRKVQGRTLTYGGEKKKFRVDGDPQWQAGERSGRGDLLEVDMHSEELLVRGGAIMRLPAREFAASIVVRSPAGTGGRSASVQDALKAGTNAMAEITCAEYKLSRTDGQFAGGVEIDHPQMRWWSEALAVRFDPRGGTAEEIVAQPARFELFNPKGQVNGQGRQAVYRYFVSGSRTNSLLTLTGEPATLSMTNGPSLASGSLVFDVAHSTFIVPPGKYRVLGPTNSPVDTNAFRFPRGFGGMVPEQPRGRKP